MLNNNILIKNICQTNDGHLLFCQKVCKATQLRVRVDLRTCRQNAMDKGRLLVYNLIANERTFSMFMFSTKEKCEKTRYLTDAFDVVRHKINMR